MNTTALPPQLARLAELSQPSSLPWIFHTTQHLVSLFHTTAATSHGHGINVTAHPHVGEAAGGLPAIIPFVRHLVTECRLTNATLVYALVYTHRLHQRLPAGALSKPGAMHRILVAALLLANKYIEDVPTLTPQRLANTLMRWPALESAWSRIALGGPATKQALWWAFPVEISRVERAMLKLLDFQLYVEEADVVPFLPIVEVSTARVTI
ncbi:hypothetical protein IWQ60_000566 [Tieghemiomyces parasiticus]|uniref:Cyclin N-terminal domain-containing protein n=1 Tax=Tieghemiomyces parasiticus TaxID=78921 RepID=A0A9W8DZ35_9FUNG|nr:hypothetical protein IWQ60_000566 [Tieghemiomyces parasiticus]